MKEVLLKISKDVPTTVFELPEIKARLDELFAEMDNSIKERFEEIKAFVTRNDERKEYESISYDEISKLFKIYFCKNVANTAVEVTSD